MKVNIDIAQLRSIGSKSKHNRDDIEKTIDLFKARKIERFDTARNIINDLSSRGVAKQQNAKDKLNFYENEYIPRGDPLTRGQLNGSNRFIRPKPFTNNPEDLAKLIIGDMHKLNSVSYTHLTLPTILRV